MSTEKNNRVVSSKWPKLRNVVVKKMIPADYNPRKITAAKKAQLKRSLVELGNLQPITQNVRTGRIIGGHQRLDILIALGHKKTPVWCVDLDDEKEKLANLALNNLAGEFDEGPLKALLAEISTAGSDMGLTGFSDAEMKKLLDDLPPPPDSAIDQGTVFEIIVTCAGETEQRALFEQLTQEGQKCRVLTL